MKEKINNPEIKEPENTDVNEELMEEEFLFPGKYTDDDGKRIPITSHAEYCSLVENETIHPNTLVHDGNHWNYHARYANPNGENPNNKDKFANMWNRMR